MKRNSPFPIILCAGVILLVTLSCGIGRQAQPTAEAPAVQNATSESPETTAEVSGEAPEAASPTTAPEVSSPSPVPEISSSPTSQPAQQAQQSITTACNDKVCILDGTFLLGRPIGAEGRNSIDTASRFGTIRKRVRDAYFGVQFLNSTGTPVLAAADGDVIVAGDDSQTLYGPRLNMFGNLVILRHFLPGISEPVYTLYAHLSEVSVKAEGDVKAGEQIGLVGMTGSVSGSTLYFEVRLGENAYDAARNPELWLQLLPDDEGNPTGVLAGRVVDADDKFVPISNILVEQVRRTDGTRIRPIYLKTYYDRHQRGNNPWNESFAASNLPEGTYQVSFWYRSKLYQREVEVQPGKVTFLAFTVK